MLPDMLSIDYGDDRIQLCLRMQYLVGEERLNHRTWIGQSGGLNQQVIEFISPSQKIPNDPNEVATNGATNASVVHFQNLLVRRNNQLAINPYLSELVDNHGHSTPSLTPNDPI